MSKEDCLPDCHILIGGEDVIVAHISELMDDNPDDPGTQEKALRKLGDLLGEMRVRVGTLLKIDNISFLFGAGASIAAGGLSLANIPKPLELELIEKAKTEQKGKAVPPWIALFYESVSLFLRKSVSFEDRSLLFQSNSKDSVQPLEINLETYLSYLYAWLAAIVSEAKQLKLEGGTGLTATKVDLEKLIHEIKRSLTRLLNLPREASEESLQCHRKFIKKILTRPLNLRRANIFTLNYDTLIEQAGDAEGSVLVDGFVGNLRRVFRPESYDIDFYFPAQTTEGRVHRFDRAIHLYKLHGSITWHRCEQDWENPFGLYASFYDQDCDSDEVLIYPSPLKYGQALGLPYSELFRRFGLAIAQPQSALFAIGYGFGDEHVNALIRQALAIPSFTLVVVDPQPKGDFVSKLEKLKDERVWIIKGRELGAFEHFVEKLLPDLKEEQIVAKVMRTVKELSTVDHDFVNAKGDGDGERS